MTSLVFWLAHAYAGMLARGATGGAGGIFTPFRAELARHWPLVTGSLPPALPLLLAPLGLLSDDSAESLAIGAGIAVLAAWSIAIELRLGRGWVGVTIGAAASVAFALVIVGLKAVVH